MTVKRTKRSSTPPGQLGHRWYLPEWAAFRGKKQADAERELGWPRAKTSDLWNLKQRYTQESIDEAAVWLEIDPFELLLPPDEAISLRQLRAAAHSIVANDPPALAAERGRPFRGPPTGRKV